MEATGTSTLLLNINQLTWLHIPEDCNGNIQHGENLILMPTGFIQH
jgi:hypothetical protein